MTPAYIQASPHILVIAVSLCLHSPRGEMLPRGLHALVITIFVALASCL